MEKIKVGVLGAYRGKQMIHRIKCHRILPYFIMKMWCKRCSAISHSRYHFSFLNSLPFPNQDI